MWNDQYGKVIFVCGHLLFIDIFELLHIYRKNIGTFVEDTFAVLFI